MQKRKLGAGGPDVSIVGLGANNFGGRTDAAMSERVIAKALDCGITLIDTSDNYGNRGGSETILGNALGARRKDVVLATKFGLPMDDSGTQARRVTPLRDAGRRSEPEKTEDRLDRSLSGALSRFRRTPIDETLRALDDLVKAGKVRFIGCSNFSAAQLQQALGVSQREHLAAFVTCQDQYNLLERGLEKDRLPVMRQHGLGCCRIFRWRAVCSPANTGRTSAPPAGTRFAGATPRGNDAFLNARNWRLVQALSDFAAKRGHTLLELAFSWLLSRPSYSKRYCGGDQAGTNRAEYCRCGLDAVRRRYCRDRSHNSLI